MTKTSTQIIFGALLALVLVACGGTGSGNPSPVSPTASPSTAPVTTPAPGATPSPSPIPSPGGGSVEVGSAAQAAALVFASDPRWAGIVPLRSDLIGASSWFEASEDADGFSIVITFGRGDCEAGCIEKHNWNYHVDLNGTVTLVGESGDPFAIDPIGHLPGHAHLNVKLTAGPVCPVERNPPDPNCAPRNVANAEVVVYDPQGAEVARGTSDPDGMIGLDLPSGSYFVVAQPVEGLMGTPQPEAFAVIGGGTCGLLFEYDTGIR